MPRQDSPLRIGSTVRHAHFYGAGRITAFSHGGSIAIVTCEREGREPDVHYIRTEELKRVDKN